MTESLSRSPIMKGAHAAAPKSIRNFLYIGKIKNKMTIRVEEGSALLSPQEPSADSRMRLNDQSI
jgi:hypothetical protein